MARLFGFSIEDDDNKKSKDVVSPVPQNNEDGVDHYLTSEFLVRMWTLKAYIKQNLIY